MENVDENKSSDHQNRKHGPLPLAEISVYWVVWISLLSCAMYSIYKASEGDQSIALNSSVAKKYICSEMDMTFVSLHFCNLGNQTTQAFIAVENTQHNP